MSEKQLFEIILVYAAANIVLYIIEKQTSRFRMVHKVLSALDNAVFIILVSIGLYRMNRLFLVFVPCVLLIVYPVSWGMNKELGDDDLSSIVIIKSPVPLSTEQRKQTSLGFIHIATFPFFYLLKTWKNKDNNL